MMGMGRAEGSGLGVRTEQSACTPITPRWRRCGVAGLVVGSARRLALAMMEEGRPVACGDADGRATKVAR